MHKIISLFLVLLILLTCSVSAFEVQSLDGTLIDINSDFCMDEMTGLETLGSDFYIYCESNFVEEFNLEKDNIDFELEEVEYIETEEVDFSDFEFEEENKTSDWTLFLTLIGLVLLFVLVILIISRYFVRRKHEQDYVSKLKPLVANMYSQGYKKEQIESVLIQKGYDHSFISRVLK